MNFQIYYEKLSKVYLVVNRAVFATTKHLAAYMCCSTSLLIGVEIVQLVTHFAVGVLACVSKCQQVLASAARCEILTHTTDSHVILDAGFRKLNV